MSLEQFFDYLGGTVVQQVLTFKVDLRPFQTDKSTVSDYWEELEGFFKTARSFTLDEIGPIVASSAGIHLDGKNGHPHAHFHFVLSSVYKIWSDSAKSMRKRRWLEKQDPCHELRFRHMTMKYLPFDNTLAKWSILSYPLKEGHRGNIRYYTVMRPNEGERFMPVEILDALQNAGNLIYQTAVAIRERNEKCELSKLENRNALYEFAKKNLDKFNTFRQMQEFFEEAFLGNLELDELPKVENFNNNIKLVGKKLGIFRYCDDKSAF